MKESTSVENEDADEAASEEAPKDAPPASDVKSDSNDAVDEDEGAEMDETLEAELESIANPSLLRMVLCLRSVERSREAVGGRTNDD
jgi:hypothetical protein